MPIELQTALISALVAISHEARYGGKETGGSLISKPLTRSSCTRRV
jgi:hypothetical protein